MDIFISWHGAISKAVAEALREWLPSVIQDTKPFLSSEDIHKGDVWFGEVSARLGKSSIGILCLTPDNLEAPWILFEAGALSKQVGQKCVVPLLIGVNLRDLKPPLSNFQATITTKADVLKLMRTINAVLGDKALADGALSKAFEKWWPDLEKAIEGAQGLLAKGARRVPDRPQEDILQEILELVRRIAREKSEVDLRNLTLKDIGFGAVEGRNAQDGTHSALSNYLKARGKRKYSLADLAVLIGERVDEPRGALSRVAAEIESKQSASEDDKTKEK